MKVLYFRLIRALAEGEETTGEIEKRFSIVKRCAEKPHLITIIILIIITVHVCFFYERYVKRSSQVLAAVFLRAAAGGKVQ